MFSLSETYSRTSYPTQASGEYQSRRQNPFAQQDEPSEYEMSGVNGSRTHLASAAPGGAAGGGSDNATFYDEVCSASPFGCMRSLI